MFYRYILFCFFFCLTSLLAAQETVVQDLDIKIMYPTVDANIPSNYKAKVERKVVDIFTQNGVANAKGSTFVVYPALNIVEFGRMEGIKNYDVVQLELSLLVKNIFSKQDFTVFSRSISGTGESKRAAINKAIMGIRPRQKVYKDFIQEMQEKVTAYYEEECDAIKEDAETALANKEYQKAIALLNALPQNSTCRTANKALLENAYQEYQAKNCRRDVQEADIAILNKDYKKAINILSRVDVESPCAADAKQTLQKVDNIVEEQTAKKLAFLNKVYSDNKELQKAREQSMKSISNTYIEGISKD